MNFSRIAAPAGTFAEKLNADDVQVKWSKNVAIWVKSSPFVQQNVANTWIDENPAGLETAGYNVFAESTAGEIAFYDHVDSTWYDVP